MTVVATVQKLVDGPHNLVVHLNASMANTDAETAVKKIDVTTLASDSGSGPLAQPCKRLVLLRSVFSTSNLLVRLLWEASTPVIFEVFGPNAAYSKRHYQEFGGVSNNAGAGITGNVLLTTEIAGGTESDAFYDIILHFRKKYS